MGDRVSISFRNEEDESVTLYSHNGGMSFVNKAKEYVRELKNAIKERNSFHPLDRMEPRTVMVDFIRHITKNEEKIESDLYLEKDEDAGDNSDNGHYEIDLVEEKKEKNYIVVINCNLAYKIKAKTEEEAEEIVMNKELPKAYEEDTFEIVEVKENN